MMGMSLVVQWLRCHTPSAGGPGSIPGQGSRFHMQQLSVCMPQLKILLSQINKYLNFKKKKKDKKKGSLRGTEELASWRFEDEAVFHGVGTECSEALS